jgi:acyl carrier protein
MDDDVRNRVLKAIAEVLERKDSAIPIGASLREDLEMDSLKQMTLFILLEDEFHKTMQPEEVTGVVTVQDIIDFVERKLRETAPS